MTPTLNFPVRIEREWFGVNVDRTRAQVEEWTPGGMKPRETIAADGVLATLPMVFGGATTTTVFRVWFWHWRRGKPELDKVATVRVERFGYTTSITLIATD